MGIMVYSFLLWVVQDFYHQPYGASLAIHLGWTSLHKQVEKEAESKQPQHIKN